MKKPIIIITGPTASGKTAIALKVVPRYPAEIVCADSMTVYQGMDIGTDKPTLNNFKGQSSQNRNLTNRNLIENSSEASKFELVGGIPHHLLNLVTPDQEFNVAIFKKLAKEKIEEIQSRDNIPFLVGGSTMYLDAVVYDFEIPVVKPNTKLRQELEQESTERLFTKLVRLDPDAEWTIDRNNKRRLVRALEVTLISGEPFSKQKKKKDLLENVLYLAVDRDRETLYQNINSRVDEMMDIGFLDEVRKLRQKYDHNTAMQAAGYKQLIQYLDGEIPLDKAIEKTKQVHRNYAKRQLTWLRKNKDVTWVKNENEAATAIDKFLK